MFRTFAEIRRRVPNIHVFKAKGEGAGVTILTPSNTDARYEGRRYGEGYTEGIGSREYPFTYLSAAPVSPYYAIIDLWYGCRGLARQNPAVFICVNDW